jgi:hydroxyacylglutathione hydrolase
MIFERFYDRDLAHASFLIGCTRTGKALVVDPRRDLGVYLDRAIERGLTIESVAETHIHADYLSGGRELAMALGAQLVVSAEGGRDWQVQGVEGIDVRRVQDGERFAVGELHVEAIHTPGHTPEHLCLAVFDVGDPEATLVLTGDFLSVGALGRPDLLDATGISAGSVRASAEELFESLKAFGARVPHHAPLWPGHGAGSACGKALGELPVTTWGAERQRQPWGEWIDVDAGEAFVDWLLKDQPDSPTYFRRMKEWNRDGFSCRRELLRPPRLTPTSFVAALEGGALAADLRPRAEFLRGHFPGALHLPTSGKLATWTAWVLSEPTDLVLIARDGAEADRAASALSRVGHDRIVGFLPAREARRLATPEPLAGIDPHEAREIFEDEAALFVDVRTTTEYAAGHVSGAHHAPIARFQEVYEDLPKERPLVVYCGSGARATVAASVLQAEGYGPLKVVIGSMDRLSGGDR